MEGSSHGDGVQLMMSRALTSPGLLFLAIGVFFSPFEVAWCGWMTVR